MILVGSVALSYVCEDLGKTFPRKCIDYDYLCTEKEWKDVSSEDGWDLVERKGNKGHIKYKDEHYEFEIAQDNDSTSDLIEYCKLSGDYYAPLEVLYLLKMSHRYKKDSPHFLKTMRDIHFMRSIGANIPEELTNVLKKREKETYTYSHPNLNVKSKEFFNGDNINYIYDHDTIHQAVAVLSEPAYKSYMRDGSEVMTSKEKFMSQDEVVKLLGVYEESCVLALERSQIPNDFSVPPEVSFMTALSKVCTSITSGWFREFAYENYNKVVAIYLKMGKLDYIERFKNNFDLVKEYKGE